jgi:colanic acid/amylovoran biosynthesis glycosyltransferase
MKIAFLVPGFPRLSETFILNQITGLMDLGCEVHIFSQEAPQEASLHADVVRYGLMGRVTYLDWIPRRWARIGSTLRILMNHGRRHPWVLLKAMNPFSFGLEAVSLRKLHRVAPFLEGFDVIMCHFGQAGMVGAELIRMGVRSKLVTMFHGHDIRVGLEQGQDFYRKLFATADALLSISSYNRESLLRLGADPRSIVDHPVGIDTRRFAPAGKRGVNSSLTILTVARLVWEKGIDDGLRAVAELRRRSPGLDFRYRICGSGNLESQLKRLAADLRMEDIVTFRGPVDQDAVAAEMAGADIFLLPSVAEALPVCLMEAQAMRLPVVATDVGSVSEVVTDQVSGFLVPSSNPIAIADRLQLLAEDPVRRDEMGGAGRVHVMEKYEISSLNRRLLALLERLAG